MKADTTLGHYHILRPLGKGGMGEVYLAEDTRLKREVAIKVLPERLRTHPERLKRFRREAEAAARLNHPNIATIHALEDFDGVLFIAMEYVDGKSLKDVIPDDGMDVGGSGKSTSGRIPTFFDVFIPLADALAHAHGQGRIHRDLKPGNIMIAEDGTPKILDFGLARIIDPDPVQAAEESEEKPALGPDDETRSMDEKELAAAAAKGMPSLTRGGLIGTPHYMSPEQAERRETDARTDIFSFGVVMYEALTGVKPFEGQVLESIIGKIIEVEPESVPELKPVTPHQLWWTIRGCLEKNRDKRIQTAERLHQELQNVQQEVESGAVLIDTSPSSFIGAFSDPSGIHPSSFLPRSLKSISFAILFALSLATLAWLLKPLPIPPLRKFQIDIPGGNAQISPDGTRIGFLREGNLWIQDLGELTPREISSTDYITQFVWSPEGNRIAYGDYARGEIKTSSIQGGLSTLVCKYPFPGRGGAGLAWSGKDDLVFSNAGALFKVPAAGGTPRAITEIDTSRSDIDISIFAHLFPDGKALTFTVLRADGGRDLVVQKGNQRTVIVAGAPGDQFDSSCYSSTGHILYIQAIDNRPELWAVPFSPDDMVETGEPFKVAQDVFFPSVAMDGTLVFYKLSGFDDVLNQLVWVDRDGNVLESIGQPMLRISQPALSPDNLRVAVAGWEQSNEDIWIHDADRKTRLTRDPARDWMPVWTPDGKQIAFTTNRIGSTGGWDLLRVSLDAGDPPVPFLNTPLVEAAADYSQDGKYLIYYTSGGNPETKRDIWYLPLNESQTPTLLLHGPYNEIMPKISPDGRYLAYSSDETGAWEIYVVRFPDGDGKKQVSVNGGITPSWSGRGNELFYVNGNALMSVRVETTPNIRLENPRALFTTEQTGVDLGGFRGSLPNIPMYDVSQDGQRFVMVRPTGNESGEGRAVLTVVQNWIREFEED